MTEKSIQFVYFDIGNVLLLFKGGLENLAKKHNKSYDDFERIFRQYDNQVCKGLISPEQLWQIYVTELDLQVEDFDFAKYWVQQCITIKVSFDLIRDLHQLGFEIGLLSNLYKGIFSLIEQQELFPFKNWSSKVISSEHGCAKPEDQIYQIAEQQAGVPNKQILFIDDKVEFLSPAAQRGWQTFLFDPENTEKSAASLRQILRLK